MALGGNHFGPVAVTWDPLICTALGLTKGGAHVHTITHTIQLFTNLGLGVLLSIIQMDPNLKKSEIDLTGEESDTPVAEKKPETPVPRTSRAISGFAMLSGYPASESSWKPLIGRSEEVPRSRPRPIARKTESSSSSGLSPAPVREPTSPPSSPRSEAELEHLSSANRTLWNLLNTIEPPRSFGEDWELPDKRKLQSIGITDPLVLEKAAKLTKRMTERIGRI